MKKRAIPRRTRAEDLEDLAAINERKNEGAIPLDEFIRALKRKRKRKALKKTGLAIAS